jgi:hypothetical protein
LLPVPSASLFEVIVLPYEYVNELSPSTSPFIIFSVNPIPLNGVGIGGVEPSSD